MTAGEQQQPTSEEGRYRPVLARQGQSRTLRAIWRRAYGDDYPEEEEPLGFITRSDLARMPEWLRVGPDDTFVDLGCGRGGPGLWLVRATGASVVGVDIAAEAIQEARRRAAERGMSAQARFQVGSFTATGLPSTTFQAAVSIDSLWMVLNKPAAMREVARILAPGSRWVCTTWEPAYFRYRNLLQDAGFEVLMSEEAPNWRSRQLAVYEGILRERDRLTAELGPEAAAVLISEAEEIPELLADHRRLLIVAAH